MNSLFLKRFNSKYRRNYTEFSFADSSVLASYMVSNKTKEFVTVALTGDGGMKFLVVIISTILGN
jgi:hypothetical protein